MREDGKGFESLGVEKLVVDLEPRRPAGLRFTYSQTLELRQSRQVFLPDIPPQLHVYELTLAADFHQACVRELLDVVRERRWSDRQFGLQLIAGHLFTFGNALQDLEAAGVGESLGDAMELF